MRNRDAPGQKSWNGTTSRMHSADTKSRVFVYGSLLSRLNNHHYMNGSRLVDANARTEDIAYAMVFGGDGKDGRDYDIYPYVVEQANARPCDDIGPVRGEVYEVNRDVLDKLDELEEHPVEYCRKLVAVRNHNEPAWMYICQQPATLQQLQRDESCKLFESVHELDWRAFYATRIRHTADGAHVHLKSRRLATTLGAALVVTATTLVAWSFTRRRCRN